MNSILEPEVFFDNLSQKLDFCDPLVLEKLEIKNLINHNKGTLSLRGASAELFEKINQDVKSLAASMGAEEIVLPASVGLEELHLCGHLSRFHHLLTLQTSLLSYPGSSAQPIGFSPSLSAPERACTSAVCLSSYPVLAGKIFSHNETLTLTALGRCFRNEVIKHEEPLRLREFNMRELIFFGTEEFVKNSLQQCRVWQKNLLVEGQLRGIIQSAEDPFFPAENDGLIAFQRATKSKFELLLTMPGASEFVAVSSVNQHGNVFSKAFDIRFSNGDFIHTGCFGVGIERLALMILIQQGLQITRWPVHLKNRFSTTTSFC